MPVEFPLDAHASVVAETMRILRVGQDSRDGIGEFLRIAGIDEQARFVVRNRLDRAAGFAGHDRLAVRVGFGEDETQPLDPAISALARRKANTSQMEYRA